MPQPTLSEVFVDPSLTNLSVNFVQDKEGYIAHRVFPIVPVDKPEGIYYVWSRDDLLRSDAKRRAPGTESAGKTMRLARQTYTTEQWSLHYDLPDELRSAQDDALALEQTSVEIVTEDLLIQRDVQWVTAYFTTGIWGADVTPSPLWNAASATIVVDVLNEGNNIKTRCGRRPNKFVTTPDVWVVIKNDADIIDRIKHTQFGEATPAIVAELFEVDEVLIIDSIQNTAQKGATFAGAFLATSDALLVYANPAPALNTPSGGYIFSWPEFDDVRSAAEAGGAGIRTFRMEKLRSDRFEGTQQYEMNLVANSCGVFFDEVLV